MRIFNLTYRVRGKLLDTQVVIPVYADSETEAERILTNKNQNILMLWLYPGCDVELLSVRVKEADNETRLRKVFDQFFPDWQHADWDYDSANIEVDGGELWVQMKNVRIDGESAQALLQEKVDADAGLDAIDSADDDFYKAIRNQVSEIDFAIEGVYEIHQVGHEPDIWAKPLYAGVTNPDNEVITWISDNTVTIQSVMVSAEKPRDSQALGRILHTLILRHSNLTDGIVEQADWDNLGRRYWHEWSYDENR